MIFENRQEAGKQLALLLQRYRKTKVLVVALPRGGVPVGYEIARFLHAPLDVIPVRKLGLPHNPEYGIGAVALGEELYIDNEAVRNMYITPREIAEIAEEEIRETERREHLYRSGKKPLQIKNRIVILVDDGLATGVTAYAAIHAIQKQEPKKLILAVPVCPVSAAAEIRKHVDEFVCLEIRDDFRAVGNYYNYFPQVSDKEVIKFLKLSL